MGGGITPPYPIPVVPRKLTHRGGPGIWAIGMTLGRAELEATVADHVSSHNGGEAAIHRYPPCPGA